MPRRVNASAVDGFLLAPQSALQKPRGIEVLIDILAREAVKVLIAEQMKLPAHEEIKDERGKSADCNRPALGGRRRYKDQILSSGKTCAR